VDIMPTRGKESKPKVAPKGNGREILLDHSLHGKLGNSIGKAISVEFSGSHRTDTQEGTLLGVSEFYNHSPKSYFFDVTLQTTPEGHRAIFCVAVKDGVPHLSSAAHNNPNLPDIPITRIKQGARVIYSSDKESAAA
jgi:hypothetical protein